MIAISVVMHGVGWALRVLSCRSAEQEAPIATSGEQTGDMGHLTVCARNG